MQHRTVTMKILALACVLLLAARPALAAPLSPSAAVGNDTTFGGTTPWVNPTNILSSNDAYTTAQAKGSACGGPISYQTLRASGFGAAIPAGETVVGITVRLEGTAGHGDCGFQADANSWSVSLGKAGILNAGYTLGGSNEGGWCFTGTDSICTVGGPSDRWGQTWQPSEVNAAGFSVGVTLSGNNSGISLDHLTVTITTMRVGEGFIARSYAPSRWEPLNSPGTGITLAAAVRRGAVLPIRRDP